MKVRDRIKELRRVRAADLRPNPRNWRTHPAQQQDALRAVLAEVGYADALLARELPDGTLMLVDGHLRAETTPESMVPVLVLDVDEADADKILLTHDPLAGMATVSQEHLHELLDEVRTESAALRGLFATLGRESLPADFEYEVAASREVNIPDSYQVVVECRDEDDQRIVFDRMRGDGYRCRVLTL